MTPQNLGQLFRATVQQHTKKKAIYSKILGKYTAITWGEFARRVDAVASALQRRGLAAGDRIAILSENRPEWALVDLAAQTIGAVSVPIYPSLSSSEIQYILSDSGSRMVAVSGKTLFEKLVPIQNSLPDLRAVIGFDTALSVFKGNLAVPLFLTKDLEREEIETAALEKCLESIKPDALATIIYTSGTTGPPKGVMLTHANFIHNVMATRPALRMGESDIHLSFLPLSHVFERMAGYYLMIFIGASIAYAESMDTVGQNILEIQPTFVLGVPRFYEKIHDRVLEAVKVGSPIKKALFFWAKELGEEKRLKKASGLAFRLKYGLADLFVYRKFRARLGGRVRFCVSGGAPLSKEIAEFFCDLGVMIYEGYGLTETSPVISVNREGKCKFGTVGVPLESVEVRIAQDGEIATRSDSVMKGYYNKPEETQAVLVDGWFCTGDLGQIDRDGFLAITGRKKELIVTSGGKKVSPRVIEERIEKDPYILRCVLYGEGRKFITALIVPEKERLLEYARAQKISYVDYGGLMNDRKIHEFIEQRVEAIGAELASYERIKYFALLENDFSQAAGELTPTLKVKRELVWSRYKDKLLPFYELNP